MFMVKRNLRCVTAVVGILIISACSSSQKDEYELCSLECAEDGLKVSSFMDHDPSDPNAEYLCICLVETKPHGFPSNIPLDPIELGVP